MQTKIKKLPESELEIEGQIDWADFEKHREKALKHLGEHLELPGFRKGHIPENVLLKNIPEISLLEEMAEIALPKVYLQILEENKIDAIGRPEISITKIARGNPLEFKIKTSVLPEVKLPDYKALASSENNNKLTNFNITDEELEKTVLQIRKMRTTKEGVRPPGPALGVEPLESELPELNDEFVKKLRNFANVEDFKTKLRDNLKLEKETKEKEKHRIKLIETISDKTKIEMPKILIESELDKMLYQMKGDVEMAGLKFDDYLKQINKTEADFRKYWEKEAEKRAKMELILRALGMEEKIKVAEDEIKTEAEKLLKMYKDVDPARARAYIENVLQNEKIWQFLENLQ